MRAPSSCASLSTATKRRRRFRRSTSGSLKIGIDVPLIGDFHYIGHKLLADFPACAEALDKYRINPGNVGFREKRDRQFSAIIEIALRHRNPCASARIGDRSTSELLTHLMDENAREAEPADARAVMREAMVRSALMSAARAEELGMRRDQIILSAKSRRCRI